MKLYHYGLCATLNTNNGLQRAFKKYYDYRESHTSVPSRNVITDIKSFKPDVLFTQIQTPNVITVDFINQIKPYCGRIINFTGDVREPTPQWYFDIGRVINKTLFVSNVDVLNARNNGVNSDWIQIGFDDEIFNDKKEPCPTSEIVFMANNYNHFPLSSYRVEIANALRNEFGSRFQLYGSGWKIPSLDSNGSLEHQASILRGCKIAINCSNMNHSLYTSDRMLKIMGSGAFCLSHEFQDCQELYNNTENIVIFNSISQLISQCHLYLNDTAKREEIAKNGYYLTHSLYTWDKFVNNIIK